MFKSVLLTCATLMFCYGARATSEIACRPSASSNGKYVIFNKTLSKSIDTYAFKSLEECRKIVTASRYGITCLSTSDGKSVLYNFEKQKHLDTLGLKTTDQCLLSLRAYRPAVGLICLAREQGTGVIYNVKKNKSVDTYQTKSLSECNRTVLASRDGITCISSDSSKRVSLYDYHREAFLGQWNKPLDECIAEL